MLDQFAEELKQAREKNDLTIQQLAAKTRIDLKFLEQMEFGDFSFLPDVYVRAFIKDYSKVVGLDETITLKKFESAKKGQLFVEDNLPEEKEEPVESNSETNPPQKEEVKRTAPIKKLATSGIPSYESSTNYAASSGRKINNVQIGIMAIVVLAVAFVIYNVFFSSSNELIFPEKPYAEIINDAQRYDEKPEQPSDSLYSTNNSDSLLLTIQALDSSWIKIITDEKTSDDFIMTPNSKKSITAKQLFKITLGNSGGVNLYLNNKLLNFSGKQKTSMSFRVDASGLSQLQNQH
ncbi:MAG: DUF4115 domain-containing protein [Ignavibacteriaceae bacterium]|nr:DUF4115 domain-containing protein [Ignavibacteriaceae bacterium]